MRVSVLAVVLILALLSAGMPVVASAADCGPRSCIPDIPVPAESVGPMGLPFDLPVWPTLLKTEFHILPWVTFGKVSVCLPGTGKAVDLPAPCLSLKPIPMWIPWLRPLDSECKDNNLSWVP